MVALRVTGFAGTVPRRGARFLEQNQAQIAVNCRLTSGFLFPLKAPKLVNSPGVVGIKTIYRMTDGINDFWLAWAKDVDAVKGPIAGDNTFRTYYTGDDEPRVTDLSLATTSTPFPQDCYVLGVFPPKTAASLTHAGGAGVAVSRSFVYTFVTQWGEESQPSPASAVVVGKVDGTWTIGATTGMDVAPLNSFTVTSGAWAGGNATLGVASTFGLRVGETVDVSGVTPAGYNGTRLKITALTAASISYAIAVDPGAWSAGGTIARAAPHNVTSMVKRIYWTETDAAGVTSYRFVKEVAVATTNTTVDAATVSAEALPSIDWAQPPTDMKGLVSLPNGILAAFRENELLFSEPYKPYAWPVKYRLTTDYAIVGLGTFLTTVVVCTAGIPYVCTGSDPAQMILDEVDQPWPCLAKRGIVAVGYGVAFPTPLGLALIGSLGSSMTTADLYTQEEWLAQVAPASFAAAHYAGRYVASYDAGAARQVIILDKREFASVVNANSDVEAVYGDPASGRLYVVVDDVIYEWDADDGLRMTADWLSREWVFSKPINLGAAKLDADFAMSVQDIAAAQIARQAVIDANAALIAANATKGSLNAISLNSIALNGSKVKSLPDANWDSLTFQLYVDGALKFSKMVVDNKPFRLPAGYKSDTAAVRVQGNMIVKAIVMAETMKQLAAA